VNASSKPQRRRKSSLAGEHPAYPAPVPQQATQQQQPPSPEQGGGADEARARKYARDAAYGWAATRRKLDSRTEQWTHEVTTARDAGTLPGVLREQIGEAADRAGIPLEQIPDEVWHAAGIPPQ